MMTQFMRASLVIQKLVVTAVLVSVKTTVGTEQRL